MDRIWVDDCAAGIAQQFLRDPVTPPDASCIDAMPPTDFLTGEDIQATSSIYRLDSDLVRDRDPVQIAIAALTILVFIATLVYAAVYGLDMAEPSPRRRPRRPRAGRGHAAGLNLAYVGGLVFVLLNTDRSILGFGLPSGAWPLLVVPFIALSAAVLLIVSLIRAWMQEEGSLFHRVVLSVSAAGVGGASPCGCSLAACSCCSPRPFCSERNGSDAASSRPIVSAWPRSSRCRRSAPRGRPSRSGATCSATGCAASATIAASASPTPPSAPASRRSTCPRWSAGSRSPRAR